jgi:hypothetical protein
MSRRSHHVKVSLDDREVIRLDELRGGQDRAVFFRELLRKAGPVEETPSRREAIRLLAESARAGRVAAQVALARELRDGDGRGVMDWILHGDQ